MDERAPKRRWILPFVAGLAVGAAVLFVLLRDPAESLTSDRLRAARELWSRGGLKDYRLVVDIEGVQHGRHEITVRDGKVTAMTTEGAAVPENVWRFWAVEGMFTFLETELANMRDPARAHGVSDPSQVVLRASFDHERGYPATFLRHVMGGGSSVRWTVVSFSPL